MPGDTYTPPQRHREDSTVFDDGNVLEFRKAGESLKAASEVQAARDVQAAYEHEASASPDWEPTPVEYAALQLAELHKVRLERIAA